MQNHLFLFSAGIDLSLNIARLPIDYEIDRKRKYMVFVAGAGGGKPTVESRERERAEKMEMYIKVTEVRKREFERSITHNSICK